MSLKVYYFNDRHRTVTVQVNHKFTFDPLDPGAAPKIEYFKLKPLDGELFEIEAPEGAIPFVKVWENDVVLLTYFEAEALESLQLPSRK